MPGRAQAPLEPAVTDFFRVEGEEVHEVAVGPVHAGVIEPGHFRFQCHGETVFHLEIALGYQHRGIERALAGGPHPLSLKFAETAAGDTTIGHGWAYCQLLEGLAGVDGARPLPVGAGHRPGAGALRQPHRGPGRPGRGRGLPAHGLLLRAHPRRLAEPQRRALRQPPGPGLADARAACAWTWSRRSRRRWSPAWRRIWADTQDAVELLWGAASVLNRFEAAGFVDPIQAREVGLVGVPARACGIELDVRRDHPFGPYARASRRAGPGPERQRAFPGLGALAGTGRRATRFLAQAFASAHGFRCRSRDRPDSRPWRPTACASPSPRAGGARFCTWPSPTRPGRFARYKLVDPSFHNWFGLALALRGEQISDFPLCNKSFNLSYCGHDL